MKIRVLLNNLNKLNLQVVNTTTTRRHNLHTITAGVPFKSSIDTQSDGYKVHRV